MTDVKPDKTTSVVLEGKLETEINEQPDIVKSGNTQNLGDVQI